MIIVNRQSGTIIDADSSTGADLSGFISVTIRGWRDPRHEKRISLTHILQQHCKTSLAQAKFLLDKFVDDGRLRIYFEGERSAAELASAASDIGLICELEAVP